MAALVMSGLRSLLGGSSARPSTLQTTRGSYRRPDSGTSKQKTADSKGRKEKDRAESQSKEFMKELKEWQITTMKTKQVIKLFHTRTPEELAEEARIAKAYGVDQRVQMMRRCKAESNRIKLHIQAINALPPELLPAARTPRPEGTHEPWVPRHFPPLKPVWS